MLNLYAVQHGQEVFSDKGLKMQKAARDIWGEYAKGNLSHGEAVDKIFSVLGGKKEREASWHGAGEGATGLGNVKIGSYERPTNITAETPAVSRYKSNQKKADGGYVRRAYKKGGKVEGSVWNDLDANPRGPINSSIVQHALAKIGASLPATIDHTGSVTGRRH